MSAIFGEEVDDGSITTVDFESPQQISAADRHQPEEEGENEESDDDFEFAVVTRDFEFGDSITADEIFSNGRILPVYPVFNRDLLGGDTAAAEDPDVRIPIPIRRIMIEDRIGRSSSTSSSSSEADEIEGVNSAESYCVLAQPSAPQSPELCKKSASTGSSSRWRLRDLVLRSHSDGKEKFVFLRNPNPNPNSKAKSVAAPEEEGKGKTGGKGKVGKVKEMDLATAHRIFYGKGGAAAVKGGKRSFLPYRQELFGFFAGGNRSHHPF